MAAGQWLLMICMFSLGAQAQKIKVEYNKNLDFSRFKTFAWGQHDVVSRPMLALAIIGAVEQELTKRGLRKVENNPDVFIQVYGSVDSDMNVSYSDPLYSGMATNLSVAMMYPKLAKKYGPVITYDEKPSAHSQVEFGFDVDQVAEENYAPHAYHDFIGFEVSKPVLERAFADTYCIDLSSIFVRVDLAIGSYRHAVSSVIPRTTKVAWHMKRHEIQNSHPNEVRSQFIYNVSHSEYRKDWGNIYEKPGISARIKAFLLRLVPKVGPFSALAFHPPTPAVEQLYMHSFNETLKHYRGMLVAQQEGRLQLPNDNLDTGELTEPTAYPFTDKAYAELLAKVSGKPISGALRSDILVFYADLGAPLRPRRTRRLGRMYSMNWAN